MVLPQLNLRKFKLEYLKSRVRPFPIQLQFAQRIPPLENTAVNK